MAADVEQMMAGGSPDPELTDEQALRRLLALEGRVGYTASRGTSYAKFLDAHPPGSKLSQAESAELKEYIKGVDRLSGLRQAAREDRRGGSNVEFTAAGNRIFFTGPKFSAKFRELMAAQDPALKDIANVVLLLTLAMQGFNALLKAIGLPPLFTQQQADAHLNAIKKAAKAKRYTVANEDDYSVSIYDEQGRPVDASTLLADIKTQSKAMGYTATTSTIGKSTIARVTANADDPTPEATARVSASDTESALAGSGADDSASDAGSVESSVGPPGTPPTPVRATTTDEEARRAAAAAGTSGRAPAAGGRT